MLVGGLVIIALHSYWRGPAAIVVSIMGWLMALRGLLLLAFPTAFMSMANWVIEMGDLWRAVCIGFAAIGLYLTYVGWMPASDRSAHSGDATRICHVPRDLEKLSNAVDRRCHHEPKRNICNSFRCLSGAAVD